MDLFSPLHSTVFIYIVVFNWVIVFLVFFLVFLRDPSFTIQFIIFIYTRLNRDTNCKSRLSLSFKKIPSFIFIKLPPLQIYHFYYLLFSVSSPPDTNYQQIVIPNLHSELLEMYMKLIYTLF